MVADAISAVRFVAEPAPAPVRSEHAQITVESGFDQAVYHVGIGREPRQEDQHRRGAGPLRPGPVIEIVEANAVDLGEMARILGRILRLLQDHEAIDESDRLLHLGKPDLFPTLHVADHTVPPCCQRTAPLDRRGR